MHGKHGDHRIVRRSRGGNCWVSDYTITPTIRYAGQHPVYDLSSVDAAAERERPPEKYPYAQQVSPATRTKEKGGK